MENTPGLTETVARYVRELRYEDLPDEVVDKAKDVILDALACQLACSLLPLGRMAIDFARAHTGRPDATIIGTDLKTTVEHAALVNGILGHGDEIDEVLELFGHTSAVLVPTVLAVGEREATPGKDVIVALVAGYDIAGRLARAGFSLDELAPRNFQQASSAGSLAAAAAAGKLLGLDQQQMQVALGLAAEQACGLQTMRLESGHMNKSFHMGVGSRNGVTAAYLAQAGYGGVFNVLEPPYSIFEAFVPDAAKPQELIRQLGQRFEILVTAIKFYAAGHPMHCAIAALLTIMDRQSLQVDEIAHINVRMETLIHKMLSRSPTLNVNIEYVVAVAALDRRVTWEQYTEQRRADPVLRDLLSRVTSEASAELDDVKRANTGARPAEVTVRTDDGRTFTERVLFPPGHPRNPLSAEELEDKFMYWSTQVISHGQAKQLLSTVRELESVEDVNDLRELLLP
jgi:2-methylcitrate dehydratase PrpD